MGGTFQNRATPTTMQNTGSRVNPMGDDGVYKVDGHRRPEPHGREKNFRFLLQATRQEPALPSIFFSLWAGLAPLIGARLLHVFLSDETTSAKRNRMLLPTLTALMSHMYIGLLPSVPIYNLRTAAIANDDRKPL